MRDPTSGELSDLGAALCEVADDVASTLRLHVASDRIPHLDWTVGQLGQHVLGAARDYRQAVTGKRVWESFDGPTENLRAMQRVPEQSTDDLADALPRAVDDLVDAVQFAGSDPRPWLGDASISPGAMLNVVLADVLVHRWDLERARHRNADHVLSPHATRLALVAPLRVAHHFLTPAGEAARMVFELRIRGGQTFRLDFTDAGLVIDERSAPDADCRLSASANAFVLVGYGRRNVAAAAARGTMMAFGRKPWLGLRFPSLLLNP